MFKDTAGVGHNKKSILELPSFEFCIQQKDLKANEIKKKWHNNLPSKLTIKYLQIEHFKDDWEHQKL